MLKFFRIIFLLVTLIFSTSSPMAAGSATVNSGTSSVLSGAMCRIIVVIQGDVAKAVATIAIIFLAFGLFSGKVTWVLALMTLIAIGCVMGAGKIAGLIAGDGREVCSGITAK